MNAGKIRALKDVVSEIPDGSHIAMCGFSITRNNMAVAHEIIRQNKKNLILSQAIAAMETDILVAAGVIKKLIYSGGSIDRFGPVRNVNRAIENRSIEVEEYSVLAFNLRRMAGALGINYIPCGTLLGSDILANLLEKPEKMIVEKCPYTGETQVLLRPLVADYSIIYVNYCDEEGNAVILGPLGDMKEMANACKKLILVTDRVVSKEIIKNNPELTTINSPSVDTIVHMPYGAYPTSVYKAYDFDGEHLKEYAAAIKSQDGIMRYLDKYVYGVKDFWGYLDMCGGLKRLEQLKADPYSGYSNNAYWGEK